MILTITLNPAVDRSYIIDGFELGKGYRAEKFKATAGGKGLNVSKVLNYCNEDVLATGFLGGDAGNFIKNQLNKKNIKHDFVNIDAETRTCIAILSDKQTEILESGPVISEDDMNRFLDKFNELLDKVEIVAASGSLPKGMPKDFYAKLINLAHNKGVKFILDTSGDALVEGIKAKPFLIKPNEEEIKVLSNENDLFEAGKKLVKLGIEVVAISLGKEGSLTFTKDKVYKALLPKVKAVNPVGSGDSMIAGFAAAIKRGYSIEDTIKFASACGTSNALQEETGKVDVDKVNELVKLIEVKELN